MNKRLFRSILALKGKSQTELAKSCGMAKNTLSRKINGHQELTQGDINAIAKELELTRDLVLDIFFAEEVA